MPIRKATAADLDAIERIVAASYGPYVARIGRKPGPMLDDYAARVRAGTAWVAEREGDVDGLLVLLAAPGHLLLDNVAVDPARHRQGIGRALLDFAEQEARRQGYAELRLYTHQMMTENLVLYPALGWEETGRGEQDGFPRVFFRKPVRPPPSC